MEPDKADEVWQYMRKAGDALDGQLPAHPRHPNGRNAYAHIAICVRNKFGCSYKEISEEQISELYSFIDYLVAHPY